MRALVDIPKDDFQGIDLAENVKISYIDVMEHTFVRQQKLMDQYYFLCQCNRFVLLSTFRQLFNVPT